MFAFVATKANIYFIIYLKPKNNEDETKVTVKEGVNYTDGETIQYYRAVKTFAWDISYLNAEGNVIPKDGNKGSLLGLPFEAQAGESFFNKVRNGYLDYSYTNVFDKNGEPIID